MLSLQLPNKFPEETKRYDLDFLSALDEGETITFASCQCLLWSGTDPNPTAMKSGITTSAGSVVSQNITGGIAGNIYVLVAGIITSSGQGLQLRGQVAVLPVLP